MIVSRFAPAPTGYLHLGHVVNAVYVWGFTRARGGRVLLRIEDHDRQRSRVEYEEAIVEDLAWLGFQPDGPTHASSPTGDPGEADLRVVPVSDVEADLRVVPVSDVEADLRVRLVRQSERGAIYDAALDRLRAAGLVYACECSRADIAEAARKLQPSRLRADASAGQGRIAPVSASAGQGVGDHEPWYPGTCAGKKLAEGPGLGLRVRLAPTTEHFVDLRHGPQAQRPSEQCGDLLVKDRDGNWTYQLAATVDDHVQGVTHVIRGDDLLASTGRQLQLARLLGRLDPPHFLHHALIMKTAGQKLSKSDGDTGVRDLRWSGWTAADVIGHAAFLVGLIPGSRPIAADAISSII